VALVGDFNGWDARATPLARSADGSWTTTVSLAPGRHAYAYVIDDSAWVTDPRVPVTRDVDYGATTPWWSSARRDPSAPRARPRRRAAARRARAVRGPARRRRRPGSRAPGAATTIASAVGRLEGIPDPRVRRAHRRGAGRRRRRGLPLEPLVAKALEGVEKAAPPPRIEAAVRGMARRLAASRDALKPAVGEREITAGADALALGVPSEVLTTFRGLSRRRSTAVALGVLAQLVSRGVPVTEASRAGGRLLQRRADDGQLLALGDQVQRDLASGASPVTALDLRFRAMIARSRRRRRRRRRRCSRPRRAATRRGAAAGPDRPSPVARGACAARARRASRCYRGEVRPSATAPALLTLALLANATPARAQVQHRATVDAGGATLQQATSRASPRPPSPPAGG
jgi:hypothetical protein